MKNLIVSTNPRRRSAAQKAASRRNIKKAQAARRRSPRRRRRRNVYLGAPARRRRAAPAGAVARRRRASNPRARLPTFQAIINNQVVPAMVGGAGAVLNDVIVNMLPLPAQFKSGWARHVSKAIGAVAIGMMGGFVLQKRTADQLGAGAMTVVGYNIVRDLAAQFMPQLQLGEYLSLGEYLPMGYYGAGLNPDMATIPGSGMETAGQFTRGSPYMTPELDQWPTGSAYDDIQY